MPSSDVDSAIVWFGDEPRSAVRAARCTRLATHGGRRAARRAACASDDARRDGRPTPRSSARWSPGSALARSWIADPTQEKALILASVLVDSRPVWGVHTGTPVSDTFRLAPRNPALLRLLARFALSYRPPTGFLRGLVVEHTGEHRGRLDLKHGGVIPIVDLARWAGMAAGVTSASTTERLRAAAAAGHAAAGRRAHARGRVRADQRPAARAPGRAAARRRASPTTTSIPATLSALTRSHLKEAFRAVASIQKRVAAELERRRAET